MKFPSPFACACGKKYSYSRSLFKHQANCDEYKKSPIGQIATITRAFFVPKMVVNIATRTPLMQRLLKGDKP